MADLTRRDIDKLISGSSSINLTLNISKFKNGN